VTTEPVEIEQCEITYTNHIAQDGVWSNYKEASKVVRSAAKGPKLDRALTPEFTSLSSRYLIDAPDKSETRAPIGRLHVELDPGMDPATGNQIFILNLVARGLVPSSTDPFEFFDLGRRLIVTSFRDITTPAMHKVWKLKEST